jgi:hypothetical protein
MTDATYATVIDAVFAMNAYEHNPDDGLWTTDDLGRFFPNLYAGQLGDYSLEAVSTADENANNNFFAIAYRSSAGQTIISYRGTTNLSADAPNGYGIAGGIPTGPDATNAIAFYQEVASLLNDPWQSPSDIIVVGHSLGGGLAGFVGAIYGLHGVLFDNMPFNNAAYHAYNDTFSTRNIGDTADQIEFPGNAALQAKIYGSQEPYPNNTSGLKAYQTTDQFLGPFTVLQTPTNQALDPHAGPQDPFHALHDMALLTMLLYADVSQETAWQSIGKPLFSALFNDSLGAAIGGRDSQGNTFNASQMRTIIAYSALDSGYEPFGTTAIQSLYNDADTLGTIQSAGNSTGFMAPTVLSLRTPVKALAEIAVQFAGDQAAAANTDQDLAQGAFKLDGSVLKADLDPAKWSSTFRNADPDSTKTAIVGVGDLFKAVLANVANGTSATDPTHSWAERNTAGLSAPLLKQLNEIREIDIALDGGDLSAAGTSDGARGGAMLIGGAGQGSITGSANGNDLIIGGATVKTGDGNDIIVTSAGSETITFGSGNNEVLAGGDGVSDTYNYTSKTGTDLIVGNTQGDDTFTFNGADQAAFTVVWGGAGNDTFDINTTSATASANVLLLTMNGVTASNITSLDMSALQSYVDKTYGSAGSGAPTIVILNASSSDTLKYNGSVVSSPGVASRSTDFVSTTNLGEDGYSIREEIGWENYLTANGLDYNYWPGYNSGATLSLVDSSGESDPGELYLVNFTNGEFGVSLNAGVGTPQEITDSITVTEYLPPNSLQIQTPSGPVPAELGPVWDKWTIPPDNSNNGNLIDPDALNGPTAPAVNVNDYLEAGSDSGGGGGGSGGGDGGDGGSFTVSAIQFVSNQSNLDFQYYGLQVSDTAANISAVLDQVSNDPNVTAIALTDSGTPSLQLSASQVAADTAALNAITNATYVINVDDIAADVSANFDALNADNKVGAITLSDGNTSSLTLSVGQALLDTAALGKITNANYQISISDTAADVSAAIDALKADANVSSITLVDSGTPTLDLTVSQALNDTSILAKISNPAYAIQVEDTAANVLGEATALSTDTQVAGITIVDTAANVIANATALAANGQLTSITVEDTAADIMANAAALAANPQVKSIIVVDTAANALANAASLQGDAIVVSDTAANVSATLDAVNADAGINAIHLTDSGVPRLTLTVSQALGDTAALGEIMNPSYAVDISDTAANVAAHLDALASDTRLGVIALTDAGTPTLTVSATQLVNDAAVLADISNPNVVIDVSDTAANVSANIDALAADSKVASISLTDSGTPTLSLDAAQALGDTAALAKIADAAYSISLSDTAADVSLTIDALNDDDKIGSIALTDKGTATLMLSTAQLLDDTVALGKITNAGYQIEIFDTAANILANNAAFATNPHVSSAVVVDSAATVLAQAAAIAADTRVGSVIVSDTAANVSADIDALNVDGEVSAITLTDSGVPTLALSVAQALDDGHVLSKIANAKFKIAITDTAANVAANIDVLNADGAIGSISLTDSGTPTLDLTAGQAVSDSQVLSKITNPNYAITISDDAADVVKNAAALTADSHIASVAVTDSAANVSANFDALGAITSLNSINLTDGAYTSLVLSAGQTLDDTAELSKIAGTCSILVADDVSHVLAGEAALAADTNVAWVKVTDTAANVLNNAAALAADSKVLWITVSDTAANILANKSALAANAKVRSISVVDNAANIVANGAALHADSNLGSIEVVDTAANIVANIAALGQVISGTSINMTIAGTPTLTLSVAAALEAASISGSFKVDVVDTAANIAANIDQLNWISSIHSITPTDGGTATLSLTVSQALYDKTALGLIGGTNSHISVDDTAVNVSANFDALNADNALASITLSDTGTPTLVLTVAQALNGTSALGKITNPGYGVAISDTAANVLANAPALQADAGIGSITVVDTAANILSNQGALAADPQVTAATVADTAANVVANSAALSGDGRITAIDISDTAANISANIDALNGLTGLSSIAVTDYNNLTLTAAQALNDTNVLSLTQNYGVSADVSDTVANILSNLSALTADGQINSIAIVGSAADVVANLSALEAASFSGVITVEDTWANIVADLPTFAESSLTIQESITAPEVVITSAPESSNVATQEIDGTVNYWGSAIVPGQTVTLTDNGTTLGTATLQADGTFTATVTLLNEGDNAIIATVTDGHGNTGTSAAVVDVLDDIAPSLVVSSAPVPGNTTAQTVAGSVASGGAAAVVGQAVTLTDNGDALGTATVQADGSFSTSVTLPNQSTNAILASVTDSLGNTNNTYLATTGSGQIAIAPQASAGTANDLEFTGGITDENLWFLQSGNNLQIDILGTDTSVTVTNWFSSSANQLQEITAGGLKIDSQISQLVQAMATYSANNSGFDPTSPSISTIPNDTSLQNSVAAAWHS